jgi:putative ABC transport system permease protein
LLLPQAYVKSLGFSSNQAAVGQTVNVVVQKGFNLATAQALVAGAKSAGSLSSAAQAQNQAFPFTIAAVYKPPITAQAAAGTTSDLFYIGLGDARTLNDYSTQGTANYRKYSYAYVKVTDGTDPAKLQAVENKLKSMGYYVLSEKDTQQFLNQIIGVLRGIVVAFGLIALVASVFGIVNTMYISVLQRTREIGLMKALGMRSREVGSLFRVEAAWIGFLGGLLGSVAAVILGTAINPAITKQLDLDGSKLLIFEPLQIIILIAILMLVAIFAGLLPARKAAKLDPIEALRVE